MKRILFFFILPVLVIYLLLWLLSLKQYPVQFGISFNQNHAASLGLDWQAVYTDMLETLQPKDIRIAAMWSEVEPAQGEYDFSKVDWMMDKAAAANTSVTLVIGQKAPRWPECHVPDWVNPQESVEVEEALYDYVSTTIHRYKDHPALGMWQVENEAFIQFQFGECDGFLSNAIYQEIDMVRAFDPERDVLVTDSGELGLWTKAGKAGDVFGTTLYRVVRTPNGFIMTYDWVPAAFYRYKAALLGIKRDRFIVAELQAEPWFNDSDPTNTRIEEMEQTMTPERMQQHIEYTERIGVSEAYLWGVEWRYYMRQVHGDARYWDIAKEAIKR